LYEVQYDEVMKCIE